LFSNAKGSVSLVLSFVSVQLRLNASFLPGTKLIVVFRVRLAVIRTAAV
jgi:hypothetical protein